jgi:small-conductance mechanosensitive channel
MEYQDWSAFLGRSSEELLQSVIAYLPRLLFAAIALVVGWLVARVLRWFFSRIVRRVGRLIPSRAVKREFRDSGVERVTAEVTGHVAFWIVFLLFVAVAGQILGLQVVTSGLNRLAQYLPSVLAAVLIVVVGVMLSNFARRAVIGGAATAGIAYAEALGQTAKVAVLVVATVVALDQIGIESTLLILTLAILLGTVVGSAALAFALGAREAVSGLIAVHYLGQIYSSGDRVRVGQLEGRIVEFTATAVVLDTERGRALMSATEFKSNASFLLEEAS